MTQYTYSQLETLWNDAGGNKALAPLMAAIAMAESGGQSDNNNYNDNGGTQTSWGLWQISDGTHNQPVPNIDDPAVNAKQAVLKYQSQGLSAWGTYTSGAYQQFYQGNTPPSQLPQGGGKGGGGGGGGKGGGGGGFWGDVFNNTLGAILGPGANFSLPKVEQSVTGTTNPFAALGAIGADFASMAHDFHQIFIFTQWLFRPSTWLRIGAFIVGMITLAGAAYMFKEAL